MNGHDIFMSVNIQNHLDHIFLNWIEDLWRTHNGWVLISFNTLRELSWVFVGGWKPFERLRIFLKMKLNSTVKRRWMRNQRTEFSALKWYCEPPTLATYLLWVHLFLELHKPLYCSCFSFSFATFSEYKCEKTDDKLLICLVVFHKCGRNTWK